MFNLLKVFQNPPPFEVWHSHPKEKSRVLITAGVDGDEYVGIKAAWDLLKSYNGTIPITIIPIVNLAGYQAQTSHNPLDGRYPKRIFPGSSWGTSSSRLMHLLSQYTQNIDLWIDLHGGATYEHLTPFVWAANTGNNNVDSKTENLLSNLNTIILYQNKSTMAPPLPLAWKGASYILIESGELGKIDKKFVTYHLSIIKTLLNNLDAKNTPKFVPTYTSLSYQPKLGNDIPSNTLWYTNSYLVLGK